MTRSDYQFLCTIAGSDPTGGAGLQGDLKTFAAHGAQGASVVTAVTVQDREGVHDVAPVPPQTIAAQLTSVLRTRTPDGIKTGMLWSRQIMAAVVEGLAGYAGVLVVDPVLGATAGGALLKPDSLPVMRDQLLPRATVVTPNLPEAAQLLGWPQIEDAQMAEAAQALRALGAQAVLLKGGHGSGDEAVDVLATADGVEALALPRIAGASGHGTGCALASALTARLARGASLIDAARGAKRYVHRAISAGMERGDGWLLHHGVVAD